MLDQGVELGDLVLRLLINGLRCEVAQDQWVSGVLILAKKPIEVSLQIHFSLIKEFRVFSTEELLLRELGNSTATIG